MALSQLSMLRAQVRTGSIPLRWRVRTAATELGAVDAELGSAPVIIVGAGAAGLGCATRLARAGVPFTLLEAASRVGGRAHTSSWTDGDAVDADVDSSTSGDGNGGVLELGATWLHGTDGHPLYELALQAGLMHEPHARQAEQPEAAQAAQTATDAAALVPGGWLMPGGERVSGAELAELRVALQTAERLVDEATGFLEDAALPDAASVGQGS